MFRNCPGDSKDTRLKVSQDKFIDTAIAAYLLNPTNQEYTYDTIAKDFCGLTLNSRAELLGKTTLAEAADTQQETLCRLLCMESYIAMAAWKPLYKALEEENMRSLFFDIEMPLVFVLYEMQAEGIRVDSAALKEYGTMLGEKIAVLEQEIYADAGETFNINSPKQLGVILFEKMGMPVQVATVFMTMCVSALALTTLDAVARIGKMSFQEIFSVDDMEHAKPWRKVLCNPYFATIFTLLCGFVLTKIGYEKVWPLFGSANQLLSALVLITLCVFLKVTGRSNKMLFPPMIIMLCVTFTALVQRVIALVKAIAAGTDIFGSALQLVVAVLLITLGLIIVVNSFKSYVKSKKGSELAENEESENAKSVEA